MDTVEDISSASLITISPDGNFHIGGHPLKADAMLKGTMLLIFVTDFVLMIANAWYAILL